MPLHLTVSGFLAPLRGVAGVLDPPGGGRSSDNLAQGYYQATAFLAAWDVILLEAPELPWGGWHGVSPPTLLSYVLLRLLATWLSSNWCPLRMINCS